ncbi:restriction endonuclease subunit S [Faecalicoccus pleomorphus]|uniref:restriction endonuclease subunit S n=1 Tax=Faecalicoccus pleomorphus TaxID=1323 RepID=UPI0021496005|nr:restriction endonuclease subunit S [Faecalicoccus pleomorphus]MCR0170592.1 restriction endonuclease subunit S [[Clostridium] innocuum]MDM8292035.1 restriction endonuclease subunit S [Faecalicoccus pleomorphus]
MIVKLGDICKLNMGQSPDSSTYNEEENGLPFFQGNADFGQTHPKVRLWCSQPTKIANIGDILISVRAPIGALNFASCKCCIGRGLAAIQADNNKCLQKYLWYCLASKVDELNSKGTGSTFKAISKSILFETKIPLPPFEEQHKIAETLDKVSDLIAKRKQQLEKLDLLVKSKFVEMFGNPENNSNNFQIEKLSKYLNVIGGYAFKSVNFLDVGIPILRIGNINSGHFKPVNMVFWKEDFTLEKYKVYPNDLVMSLTGTVGKDDYGNVCILGNEYDEYYLNQRNAKLQITGNLNKWYLMQILKFPSVKSKLTGISRGVRQANISNGDILNLCIPIPPIELQNQFADFVQQTEKTKTIINQSLEKLETLKKALMQEYFG